MDDDHGLAAGAQVGPNAWNVGPADGSIASRPPVEESSDKEPLAETEAPSKESPSGAEAEDTTDSSELASPGESG